MTTSPSSSLGQARRLKPGERIPFTSEVIESAFGKYKSVERDQSKGGFTGLLLALAACVAERTQEVVHEALQKTRTIDVIAWIKTKLGETVGSKRRIAYQAARASLTDANKPKSETKLEGTPGIEVMISDRRPAGQPPAEATLFVLNEEEKSAEPWKGISGPLVVLSPRGVGPTAWVRKSPPNYVERSHVLVGKTVDEGRVWDIAATVRWLADGSGGRTRRTVAGRGQAGVIAAYALRSSSPRWRV